MGTDSANECIGWAARDTSGVLSPYTFSRRTPGSDDVWINIKYCGVCYADIVWTRNYHGNSKYPVVPGHEIVGVVREVGSNVDRFKVGDHIGVGTFVDSCRNCEYWDDWDESYCSSGPIHSFNDIGKDGLITKGGYSNHVVVHESGGRIVDCSRSSLTPKSVEALICLQDWLKTNDIVTYIKDEPSIETYKFYEQCEEEIAPAESTNATS